MDRLKSASSARSSSTARSGARSAGRNRGGKKVFAFPCIACAREGTNNEAKNYCKECAENLCESCVKQHQKFPTMKDHTFLGKPETKQTTNIENGWSRLLECTEHPGKMVDMYCADHSELWCPSCIATSHRNCESTLSILDASKDVIETDEYEAMKEAIIQAKDSLFEVKKIADTELENVDHKKTLVLRQITSFRKLVDMALDGIEQTSIQELERSCSRIATNISSQIKTYEGLISNYEALAELLSTKSGTVQEQPAIFVGVKRVRVMVNKGEEVLATAKNMISPESLRFTPDARILNWLTSFSSLGAFSHQLIQYKTSLLGNFDIRHAADKKPCDIFGCSLLQDGRVLITDWDNKNVKLLDRSYGIVDQCALPGNPNDVCVINPEEAIVSLTMQKTLQYVSVGKTIKPTRTLTTEENCRGLAFHNGELFVVCGGFKGEADGKIRVFSLSGDLLRIIEKNNTGQKIFVSPISIAISSGGKLYHVTDGQRGIVTLTHRNGVVSVVADSDSVWPCGVCVDRHDNAFVCSGKSSTVIQVSGLHKAAVLLTSAEGVKIPHSVCYDVNNLRMIVTMDKCNFISVYQLHEPPIQPSMPAVKFDLEETKAESVSPRKYPKHSDHSLQKKEMQNKNKPQSTLNGKPDKSNLSKMKTNIKTDPTPSTSSSIEPKLPVNNRPKTGINRTGTGIKDDAKTNVRSKTTLTKTTKSSEEGKMNNELKENTTPTTMSNATSKKADNFRISDERMANDLLKRLTDEHKPITAEDLRAKVKESLTEHLNEDDESQPTENIETTNEPNDKKADAKHETINQKPEETQDNAIVQEAKSETKPDAIKEDVQVDIQSQKHKTNSSQEKAIGSKIKVQKVNSKSSSTAKRTPSMSSLKSTHRETTLMKDPSPRKWKKDAGKN